MKEGDMPDRFIDFQCNCCVTQTSQNFCMSLFGFYALFTAAFVPFTVYYLVQKKKGLAGTKSLNKSQSSFYDDQQSSYNCCDMHYFTQILLYIILELTSRMGFLSTAFVAKARNSSFAVTYDVQIFLQVFPFMFTAMVIITLQKYKARVYYCFQKLEMPSNVNRCFYALQIFTLILVILIPSLMVDKSISDRQVKITNLTIQSLYLIFLSIISTYLAYRLCKYMRENRMTEIKARVIGLEIFIQMIIVSRLLTSLIEISTKNPVPIVYIMAFSFTFSELIPLPLVVYGIYLQIDWKSMNRISKGMNESFQSRQSRDYNLNFTEESKANINSTVTRSQERSSFIDPEQKIIDEDIDNMLRVDADQFFENDYRKSESNMRYSDVQSPHSPYKENDQENNEI